MKRPAILPTLALILIATPDRDAAAASAALRPLIELAQAQPLFREEAERLIKTLPMSSVVLPQYKADGLTNGFHDLRSWSAPLGPAPAQLVAAETAGFVAALAANPKVLAAQRDSLNFLGAEAVMGFERAVGSLHRLAAKKNGLRARIDAVRKTLDLSDASQVEALRGRLDALFENLGPTADRPDILAGEKLPRIKTFNGEKIKKFAVEDGIIRLATKTYGANIGIKYRPRADIADKAKWIRADIRQAVKTGTLPPGEYSVRIDRYAGGESLHAKARLAPKLFNDEEARKKVEGRLRNLVARHERDEFEWGPGDGSRSYTLFFAEVEPDL